MSTKSYFVLLIKSIGIYVLFTFNITSIFYSFNNDILVLLGVIGYTFLTLGIIFSAHRIVNLLGLTNHIDGEINAGKFTLNGILRIAIVLMGLYLLSTNLPFVISDLTTILIDKTQNSFANGEPSFNEPKHTILPVLLSSLIGFMMVTNSQSIATLLARDLK